MLDSGFLLKHIDRHSMPFRPFPGIVATAVERNHKPTKHLAKTPLIYSTQSMNDEFLERVGFSCDFHLSLPLITAIPSPEIQILNLPDLSLLSTALSGFPVSTCQIKDSLYVQPCFTYIKRNSRASFAL